MELSLEDLIRRPLDLVQRCAHIHPQSLVCSLESLVCSVQSLVCCLVPAVCCLVPAVCCLLSAVWCLVSAVCCLLSAVCCLLSAGCWLLSAVCCQLLISADHPYVIADIRAVTARSGDSKSLKESQHWDIPALLQQQFRLQEADRGLRTEVHSHL
jgi:hypothetical protein